jgi:hypothetical protein
MKNKQMRVRAAGEERKGRGGLSALDLLRMKGARARRVRGRKGQLQDSMLAVYRERVTYTFILENEVASIHYDKQRGEIFFRGHNIRNLKLTKPQLRALYEMKEVMAGDSRSQPLVSNYSATLDRLLADNR